MKIKEVKGIPFTQVKAELMEDLEFKAAYEAAKKEEELEELLLAIRESAGLNSIQVAERMGISQPAISRLERNAAKASISTLERYAVACGVSLQISMTARSL